MPSSGVILRKRRQFFSPWDWDWRHPESLIRRDKINFRGSVIFTGLSNGVQQQDRIFIYNPGNLFCITPILLSRFLQKYVLFCAYDITVWHMASVIRPLTGFLRGQIKASSLFSFIIVTKALFLSSYTIVTTSLFPISSFTIVTTISVPYFLLSL